jgi:hypothetical protein
MGKLLFIVQQPGNFYMKHIGMTLLLGLMTLALSACTTPAEYPIQTNISPTGTPVPPTATIVWFPATETPTPQPVVTQPPTPERKPGVGDLSVSDDFSSPTLWNPAVSEDASIALDRNHLTIALQPGISAFRVRKGPVLTDFYAELTARPSLCRDADQYGILFRAPSNAAYYAFVLSCNGTAWAERVRFNRSYSLHPAVPSADVPMGAPGEVRLGVWVSGSEMRFFLNGHYQFSATDPSYKSGAVGAFARSLGKTPVTVLFSDLAIYDVFYSQPPGTATP